MANTPSTPVYDLDYFSGAQFFLYIGDVWVDEVTSLEYNTLQPKTPIYGYASQLFDDMAAGQVIVQGQFTINFKEQGYLWAVLRRWRDMKDAAENNKPIIWDAKTKNHEAIKRLNIERWINGDATRGEEVKFYHDLMGMSSYHSKVQGKTKDKSFEDIVEVFEDAVWNPSVSNEMLKAQIRRPDSNIFDGFDIYCVFGNYGIRTANHTVQKISNVCLTSQSKVIKIDGEPVGETYAFLAQTTY